MEEERNYTIYMHICPNGKKYVGMTSQKPPTKRFQNGKGYKNCILFNEAILEYKWINIEHKILFNNLTKEEAENKEIELIKKYKTQNYKYGYNIQEGGCCHKHEDSTKRKIGSHFKGEKNYFYNKHFYGELNPFYGKSHTKETINKLKKINTGKKHTKETKEKMSLSQKGKHMGKMNYMFDKFGENHPTSKKCCIDNILFQTISELSTYLKKSVTTISPYLTGSKPMPQKWKERGLRYYNEETDKDLPIYVDMKDEV